MLHVFMLHRGNATIVQKVIDLDMETKKQETLAEFDLNTQKISFVKLMPYIGQEIQVEHYQDKIDADHFEYKHTKVLLDVGQDENGVDYIEYR